LAYLLGNLGIAHQMSVDEPRESGGYARAHRAPVVWSEGNGRHFEPAAVVLLEAPRDHLRDDMIAKVGRHVGDAYLAMPVGLTGPQRLGRPPLPADRESGQGEMLRLGARDDSMKERGDEPLTGSHAIGNLPLVRFAPGPVTGKEPGENADAGGAEVPRIECERPIAFLDCFPKTIGAE